LVDFIDRLNTKGYLSPALVEKGNSYDICQQLLKESQVKEAKVMDLIEFGRDIHAEMSA
jgi:hypothetical protein